MLDEMIFGLLTPVIECDHEEVKTCEVGLQG